VRGFQDLSIRHKLTLLFVAMACITATLVSVPMAVHDFAAFKQGMIREMTILADVMARNSTAALTFHDAAGARDVLQALRGEPNVTKACLYTADGKPLAKYARDGNEADFAPPALQPQTARFEPGRLIQFHQVVIAGETVGALYIESDLERLRLRVRGYSLAFLGTLLATLFLAFLLASRFQRPISYPLLKLVHTAEAISTAADYSIRANLSNRDEFGLLVAAFNGMLDQIEQQDQQLRLQGEHLEDEVASRTADLLTANAQIKLHAAALHATANSIVITDLSGAIVWTNPAFSALSGYSAEEVLGKNPRLLSSGKQDKSFYSEMWAAIIAGATWRGEIINRSKNGSLNPEEMTITPVLSKSGEITHFVAVKQDITERKRAERALHQSEAELKEAQRVAGLGSWTFDRKTGQVTWSDELYHVFRLDPSLPALPYLEQEKIFTPQSWTRLTTEVNKAMGSGMPYELELETVRADGSNGWMLARGEAVRDSEGTVSRLRGIALDITERKQAGVALRQAEEKYRALFEDAVVGIFQTTPDGCPLSVNRSFAEMHGYDSPEHLLAEVSNIALQLFVVPKRMDELREVLSERGVVRSAEVEIYKRDHTKKWVLANLRVVRDAGGKIVRYEGTVEDITDRKVAEDRVQYLAYYDVLTSLPNRTLLRDRIATALAGARRRRDRVALLYLDLDRFKIINDSLGHSVGDLLLQEVAERLKAGARELDTVARLGGDEFIIVLNGVKEAADAAIAAERIVSSMVAEFVVQGRSLNITCSLGISIFPEHGADSESLIKNADAAMYYAKDNGRNRFRFFTEELNAQALERLTLENSLRLALDKNELYLVYQPQMEMATGRITGLEALLRWQHPELGLVPPDRFIRIAENSGLIIPMGEWVMRTACAQARKWQDEGLPPVSVAVNVSAVQFRQEGFCEVIRKVLDEVGLAPEYLELELTESLLLSSSDVTFSVLKELEAMGLKLAIDDFGTGYSSLSYLKHFPVSKLKIDRSFVRDVATSPDDAAITTAIISMARSLNLKVIAEGVETEAQMSFLRAHHCDEIQGYYFSKPLPPEQVADALRGATVQ
jgi:diguanylate cyclase (GGDEF)-like protein/PAS domain S-box-containing protein